MKIGDIKNIKIARKYANALLESAIEADKSDKVYNSINSKEYAMDRKYTFFNIIRRSFDFWAKNLFTFRR